MLVNLVEAVDLALAYALNEDENVLILGEDVAKNGGVFRATQGLRERFGARRVLQKGKIKIKTVIPLSLSFDHRVLTGAEAAHFLAALMAYLQQKT